MATYQGILLDEGGAGYNVKAYGLTGDGSTDDGPALDAMIDAVPAGSTLLFPSGTYVLSTWTPKPLTERLRFVGTEPGVVIQGPNTTTNFVSLQADLELRGIAFDRWNTVLTGTGSGALDRVHVADCTVTDADYFLRWDRLAGEFVGRLVVEGCEFQGLRSGVMLASVSATEIILRDNVAVQCARYFARFLDGEEIAGRKRIVIEGNFIDGLTNGAFTGSAAVARVAQVSTERLEFRNNYCANVYTEPPAADPSATVSNANVLYTSSMRAYVEGNTCIDIGGPSNTAGAIFHEKNNTLLHCKYLNNTIIQGTSNAARIVGIQTEGAGDVEIVGNTIQGMRSMALYVSSAQHNAVIARNIIRETDSTSGAITILGGARVIVDANIVDGVGNTFNAAEPTGIRIERYVAGETLDAFTIRGNVVRGVKRAGVNTGSGIWVYMSQSTIQRLLIHGNTVSECDRGVDLRIANGGVVADCQMLGNDLTGNRLAVSLAPPTSEPAVWVTRDNRGFVTQNRGTVTYAANVSSQVVSHGLARTPLLHDIEIQLQASPGSAAKWWISNATATAFTINSDVPPGINVAVGWSASVVRR